MFLVNASRVSFNKVAYYGSQQRAEYRKVISELQAFDEIVIVNEPHCALAAGYNQIPQNAAGNKPTNIFAIDVGGGTTDFTLFTVTPQEGIIENQCMN